MFRTAHVRTGFLQMCRAGPTGCALDHLQRIALPNRGWKPVLRCLFLTRFFCSGACDRKKTVGEQLSSACEVDSLTVPF